MSVQRLTSPEAIALVSSDPKVVHIDVRSVPEFEAGHAPGAYNIPLMHMGPGGMTPNPSFAADVQARFPAGTPLLLSCKAGGRSARAAALLEGLGYSDLRDQIGGWGGGNGDPGWVAAGGPSTTTTLPGRAYEPNRRAT